MIKGTALTPAIIGLLAIGAFLAVLNFAILPEKKAASNQNTNTSRIAANNSLNANADTDMDETQLANTNSDFDDTNTSGNQNVNSTPVNTNSAVNQNTNTTTDPTAGWRTYADSKYRYSFEYPSSFDSFVDTDNYNDLFIVGTVGNDFNPVFTVCPDKRDQPGVNTNYCNFNRGRSSDKTETSSISIGGQTATRIDHFTGNFGVLVKYTSEIRFAKTPKGWFGSNTIHPDIVINGICGTSLDVLSCSWETPDLIQSTFTFTN